MDLGLQHVVTILYNDILVHIYSSPAFLMESCINLLMCVFHLLLINEINELIKKTNIPLLKLGKKSSMDETSNHKAGDTILNESDSFIKNHTDTTTKINKILSTSLSEYIKRDLQNMKLKFWTETKKNEIGEEKTPASSMEKLYEYLLTDCNLKDFTVTKDVQKVDNN